MQWIKLILNLNLKNSRVMVVFLISLGVVTGVGFYMHWLWFILLSGSCLLGLGFYSIVMGFWGDCKTFKLFKLYIDIVRSPIFVSVVKMRKKRWLKVRECFLLINLILLFVFLCLLFDIEKFFLQFQWVALYVSQLLIIWNYYTGFDGISIIFIFFSIFVITLCMLSSWYCKYKVRELFILLFILEIVLINVFCVLDLIMFYVYFEITLIPMFLLIGVWGGRGRKVEAAFKFFLYTLFGSFIIFITLFCIWCHYGTSNIIVLLHSSFSFHRQVLILTLFLIGISVKIPMYPVHLWLPEAHVEAPTVGSVILASLLLKLGGYCILRFIMPVFAGAVLFLLPLFFMFCIVGVVITSCLAIIQVDMKRLIAYSSVVHMNSALSGLLSYSFLGVEGAFISMFSHGLVSGALFLCVGFLYERFRTRALYYYGSLASLMPLMAIYFFLFLLANLAFPGTCGFVGEFLIINGLFFISELGGSLILISTLFVVVYCMLLYNKVFFGFYKDFFFRFKIDLSYREFFILKLLVVGVFMLGFFSPFFFELCFEFVVFLILKGSGFF